MSGSGDTSTRVHQHRDCFLTSQVAHRIYVHRISANVPVALARGPRITTSAAFHAYATWAHRVCLRDETPSRGLGGVAFLCWLGFLFPLAGMKESVCMYVLVLRAHANAIQFPIESVHKSINQPNRPTDQPSKTVRTKAIADQNRGDRGQPNRATAIRFGSVSRVGWFRPFFLTSCPSIHPSLHVSPACLLGAGAELAGWAGLASGRRLCGRNTSLLGSQALCLPACPPAGQVGVGNVGYTNELPFVLSHACMHCIDQIV